MNQEWAAVEMNNTQVLTNLLVGKKAIGCKWIYRLKHNLDGFIDRFKARLVAKGYNQIEGEGYIDSFSLVAKVVLSGYFLAIAAFKTQSVHQMNINNAFLHGFINEEVYITSPKGYEKAIPGEVYKLTRLLYCQK